ncbi:hypothetical protein [Clostridium sp.]|uniref:hypothetical protein n=1 Tax=Clostridium sp. TaxID=1506 RepID=UPI003216D440
MKKFSFFQVFEKSIFELKNLPKKVWIVGLIIALLSGSLFSINFTENFGDDYMNYSQEDGYNAQDETFWGDNELASFDKYIDDLEYGGSIIPFIAMGIGIILIASVILAVVGFFAAVIYGTLNYYLYYSAYESVLSEEQVIRRPMGTIVKANALVMLRVFLGLICFIIPGIVIGIKYSPLTYVLCKYPELSVDEALAKTREVSKNFRWTIFGYVLLVGAISGFVTSMVSIKHLPFELLTSSSLLVILAMAISLAVVTLSAVFQVVFGINLYSSIEQSKE